MGQLMTHEDLGPYAAAAALARARYTAESQESREIDIVPGSEVVTTLSFVDAEALGGAQHACVGKQAAKGVCRGRRRGWYLARQLIRAQGSPAL
eukprot:scaffold5041_cov107-Isochrysis_galbana.AAC.1